jgi:hypothetical protein
MEKQDQQSNPTLTPLARCYRLEELGGIIGKSLDVPPGRQGISSDLYGEVSAYPPGRRRVISVWDRLRGRGAGLLAGYIPAGPFTAWFKATNLLSGDGELVDASLLGSVEVFEAGKFFTEFVMPNGSLAGAVIELNDPAVFDALSPLVRSYAAADLAYGLPTAALLPALPTSLNPLLSMRGLNLVAMQTISFRMASDQVEIAEKAMQMQEQLDDLAIQKEMARIENQVQLDEFIRQLDPDLVQTAGLRLIAGAAAAPDESAAAYPAGQPSPYERFRSWIKIESRPDTSRNPARVQELVSEAQSQEEGELEITVRWRPGRWWLNRVLWMIFVVIMGTLLTLLVMKIAKSLAWDSPWEVISIVWVFTVGALLESVKTLYQKREQVYIIQETAPRKTFLDDMTADNRQRVDSVVREQCSSEMALIYDILNDLRGRIYRSGDTDMALEVKSLERKTLVINQEIQNPNFGRPPYLSDLKINRRVWEEQVDYDEQLLARASALSEDTHAIQQKYGAGEFSPEMLQKLESGLDEFRYRFANRGQTIKASEKEQEKYRIKI